MKQLISFSIISTLLLTSVGGAAAQRSKIETIKSKIKEPAAQVRSASRPTEFGSAKALSNGSGVLLDWEMSAETANMGFRIYRISGSGNELVNREFIFGSSAKIGRETLYGERYRYFDSNGEIGSVYQIEAQDLSGKKLLSIPFSSTSGKVPDLNGSGIPGTDDENSGSFAAKADLRMPKEVLTEIENTDSLVEDPAMHLWVMSHPGVRIDVKSEGIFRVTFAELQAAGFNTAADPANWQLYLRGVEQAIRVDVGQSIVEFYGKGVDTQETEIQGYFLINGPSAGKRMTNLVSRPSNATVVQNGSNQTFSYTENVVYLSAILNGPSENYFGRSVPEGGTTISFDLKGVDLTKPTASLFLRMQGYSATLHSVRLILNGQELGSIAGVAQFSFSGSFELPTALLKDAALGQGSNTLNLASVAGGGDFNLFDSFELSFSRKPVAQQNTVKAYTLNAKKNLLRGFQSANVRVFDITNENEPRLITNLPFHAVDGAFGVDLPGARPRVYFAAEDTAVKSPAALVPFDGEVLSSPTLGAELVILTDTNLRPQADQWGAYRTGQGVSVKVVNVDEVMNEFGFGVLGPDPIEAFLNYAYNNWQVRPKYVLLIGDSSFDSRNYQNQGYNNKVPSRIITTIFSETASDESLADFNDDGLSEIAMGRIPARTAVSVTRALGKVVNWEANLVNPLNRGAAFAFDEPIGYDFEGMSGRMRDEIQWPVGVTPTMVYRGTPTAASDLITAMNSGKFIVNYSGHGSEGAWASTNFFWSGNVSSLTNANNESLFTMLTCLNGAFNSFSTSGLAEVLLDAPNGGAVAAWASTGKTTADVQEVMGRRFYQQIGLGNIPRMGDLIMDAKTTISGGTDVRLSWALLGDPMLKVR